MALGEFEQAVLLAILQLDDAAHALDIREELDRRAGRRTTRSALYTTLDRLERKGMVTWAVAEPTPDRGGLPRRRYTITDDGIDYTYEYDDMRKKRRVLEIPEAFEKLK